MLPSISPGRGSPGPVSSMGWGRCQGRQHWDVPLAQQLCESAGPPSPLPPSQPLPVPASGTHRVNPGIGRPACLAASGSPAPTPYKPSWKAASVPAGGAGGWAWEAPRVSRTAPLPQHFQGLNSFGSCGPVGAPAELTHVLGVVHQENTFSLSLKHTQPCTPMFKHTLPVPTKANTH